MLALSAAEATFLEAHRVARLATADARGRPHVIPICFAYDGHAVYSALDLKPKRAPVRSLRRVRNVRENPRVALVVDDYSDNWTALAYLMIEGSARLLEPGPEQREALRLLLARYEQYRAMNLSAAPVLAIEPERAVFWRAG